MRRLLALIAVRSACRISEVVPDSGHYIQVGQPGAVIDAVRRVAAEVLG